MENPRFAVLQKVRNEKRRYGITPRIPGGFITPEQLITIAEVAKKYKGQLKFTSGQRLTILGLKPEDVELAWDELGMEAGVRESCSIKNVEVCPASFCKRAKQNATKLGLRIEKKYYGRPAPNRTKIGVAGCLNACSSVNSKDIGVLGNEEGYCVRVGGSAGYHPRLADELANGLDENQAEHMVDATFDFYATQANSGEKLGHFIDRIGFNHFKEGVLALYNQKNIIVQ